MSTWLDDIHGNNHERNNNASTYVYYVTHQCSKQCTRCVPVDNTCKTTLRVRLKSVHIKWFCMSYQITTIIKVLYNKLNNILTVLFTLKCYKLCNLNNKRYFITYLKHSTSHMPSWTTQYIIIEKHTLHLPRK
jgi:hypothetical protein